MGPQTNSEFFENERRKKKWKLEERERKKKELKKIGERTR